MAGKEAGLTSASTGGVLHVVEHCGGGVETYVQATIRRQRAEGRWGPIRLAADPAHLDARLADLADSAAGYQSSRAPLGAIRAARQVQRIIDEIAPDIVHLHSSYPGVYGRMFADLGPEAPAIVYCPHGWSFDMDAPAIKRDIYQRIERRLMRATDVTIAISEHEHQGGEAVLAPPCSLALIPHGVAEAAAGPRPPTLNCAHLNLLFVGRFGRQKGLDLLLSAFKRVRRQDVRLHILGGPNPGRNAAVATDDPRITAHGWIDHSEIDAWYAAADALIVPSRWEGFGLVTVEAMRNRTAVIASIRGALPEVLDHGAAGRLFDPEDAGALARLIDGLERCELKRMGVVGFERYQACYAEDRAAAALDDAYERALERRRRRQ